MSRYGQFKKVDTKTGGFHVYEINSAGVEVHTASWMREDIADLLVAAPDMLRCLKWFVAQFQGDSGTGDSHWEQFEEYLTACRIIERLEKEQRELRPPVDRP